jgi:hypothetical protein
VSVTAEREGKGEGFGSGTGRAQRAIHADLKVGADVTAAQALQANGGISTGFKLHGAGFIVTPEEAARLEADAPIKPYRNGRDLTDRPRGVKLIDLYGHRRRRSTPPLAGDLPMGAGAGEAGARPQQSDSRGYASSGGYSASTQGLRTR